MRIAHVTATFPPYQGGTGNVCYHNAIELVRLGHQVSVFTAAAGQAPSEELISGVRVIRLKPGLRFGNAIFLPQLAAGLANYDVIHLHYPFYGGESAAWAARAKNIPLCITYHQDVLLKGFPALVERLLRATLSRWVLKSARKVLFTTSDYGLASHARTLLKGRERSIDSLPNGVDIDFYSPQAPQAGLQDQFHLQATDQVIVMVASLDRAHYFKGIPVLFQAMAGLPGHIKAILVGDGDLRPDYETAVRKNGLAARVFFAGRVAQEDLPKYYHLADLTTLPSTTMGEAFGLVILESFASGKPAVASNLPGVRTIIADGVDGFLATPGDPQDLRQKITRLLGIEPHMRAEMGKAGRKKVETQYAWPIIGKRLEAIYQECLGDAR